MGATHKTTQELDDMVEHVRYEVLKVVDVLTIGNGWCGLLRADFAQFTAESVLEAGLLHMRCVIEFLGNDSEANQVMARDYLPGRWDWRTNDELDRVWQVHGRLAHLGKVRASVASAGAFSWQGWLDRNAPPVMRGFRDFLIALRDSSDRRYAMFLQPRPALPYIDLIARLDELLAAYPDVTT